MSALESWNPNSQIGNPLGKTCFPVGAPDLIDRLVFQVGDESSILIGQTRVTTPHTIIFLISVVSGRSLEHRPYIQHNYVISQLCLSTLISKRWRPIKCN